MGKKQTTKNVPSDPFPNLFEWIQTLSPDDVCALDGMTIKPGTIITDPVVFLQALQQDAAQSHTRPRARWGALQEDLRFVFKVIGEKNDSAK